MFKMGYKNLVGARVSGRRRRLVSKPAALAAEC